MHNDVRNMFDYLMTLYCVNHCKRVNIYFSAQFGSSVVAYFKFLRWVIFLNLFIAVLITSVIVLPHVILKDGKFKDSVSSVGGNHYLFFILS